MRILRPEGFFFIIDNCLVSGEFAGVLARYGYSRSGALAMQQENDAFYARHGFSLTTVESEWKAPDRDALNRVMAMEFGSEAATAMMTEVRGSRLSYHYRVYYRWKALARSG